MLDPPLPPISQEEIMQGKLIFIDRRGLQPLYDGKLSL